MIIRYLLALFWLLGFWMLFSIPDFSRIRPQINRSNLDEVSVVIPARNEALRIAPLLKSLQSQTVLPAEVIVVDDHSEDLTAELARKAGFIVSPSSPLPAGWQGKSWASWQGAQKAKGKILLFLDADTELETDGLAKIHREFMRKETPLSIQPYHRIQKLYENLSVYFNIIVMMGTSSFTPHGDKVSPTAFFGPCQMMKKSDFFHVGGHTSAKSSLLDDLALGRIFSNAGIPIRNRSGRGAVCFRMYPQGISDIVEGWSKNFALGSQSIGILPALFISLWIYASFNVSLSTIRMVITPSFAWAPSLVVLYGLYALQLWWMIRKVGNFSILTAAFFPISLLFFTMVFARALYLSAFIRKVTWKGRILPTRKEP